MLFNAAILFILIILCPKTDGIRLCMTNSNSHIFSNFTTLVNTLPLEDNIRDCLKSTENENHIFTISSPNELFFLPPSEISDNIAILGQFQLIDYVYDKSQSTVVITTENINLEKLEGLKYCHPGANVKTPPSVTNEFVRTILNYSNNSKSIPGNQTLFEYNYFLLNSILGPSCTSNIWSFNKNLVNSLEKSYPKLFELCSNYNHEVDAFEQSLQCLISGYGNIAVTSLEKLDEYKQKMLSHQKNYFYLCKNNTLQKLDDPCVWKNTSWPLLIGNKNYIEYLPDIQKTLKNYNSFPEIMHLPNYINKLNEYQDLDKIKHNRTISWCTTNEIETKQCELLQKVFLMYDIHVTITSCVKIEGEDEYECIYNMTKGDSSVTFSHSDQLLAKRSNLKVAVYADSGANLIKSVLFVDTTKIKTIDDLRNKSGCFSEYGSIDMVSFISTFKSKILSKSCDYDEDLNKFVGDSCMPGIRRWSKDGLLKGNVDVERVCKICEPAENTPTSVNCNPYQSVNIFATSDGAMDCLIKSAGQFAVIKIDDKFNISNKKIGKNIMVMCKNGTLVEYNRLDDECCLSVTTYGGIVTKEGLDEDVKLAFFQLKERNLQYNLLPHSYISNLFSHLFHEKFIKDFVDVETCKTLTSHDSCKHILKLDNLIYEVDSCQNKNISIENTSQNAANSCVSVSIVTIVKFFIFYFILLL